MSSETRSKRSNIIWHKKQIESHLRDIEKANGAVIALMNKMVCDSDFNDIQDDVIYALNDDFSRGEHLLVGLLEVMERMNKRKSKTA